MALALDASIHALDSAVREDFVVIEGLACPLLREFWITTARYDAFLDSTVASALARDPSARLGPPDPRAPQAGAIFDKYPRTTTLRWAPVAGAHRYVVEVQVAVVNLVVGDPQGGIAMPKMEWVHERGGLHAYVVSEVGLRFDFVGAQTGRWRVRALDAQGRAGVASPWQHFKYLR